MKEFLLQVLEVIKLVTLVVLCCIAFFSVWAFLTFGLYLLTVSIIMHPIISIISAVTKIDGYLKELEDLK